MIRIKQLADVVNWRLCLGCGACAYVCPEDRVRLMDFPREGIRPVVTAASCGGCRQCLEVCPAVQSVFPPVDRTSDQKPSPVCTKEWGPVVSIWEGHAASAEVRFKGSSGGALTAIAAYCLEVRAMYGVLHIGPDPKDPIRNRTRLSRTSAEVLAACGSRYSPASVCNGLGLVEAAPSPCVVIGKPSEIAALSNARRMRPKLDQRVGLTLSFFCAESPATRGTTALLEHLEVDPGTVGHLRYRGHGWPGHFAPTLSGSGMPCQKMTYRESWSFLQAFRPWSAQLWPDGSGELADITCGDPWYEAPAPDNPGFSLVVVRTQRGREILEGAMAAGYLTLKPAENWKLVKSQSGLIEKKGATWGRRLAMRLLGLPVTRFEHLNLWHCWCQLSGGDRLRSIVGTFRRIVIRKQYLPMKLGSSDSVPVRPPMIGADDQAPGSTPIADTHGGPAAVLAEEAMIEAEI